jgi:hypothetical protein
MTWVAAAIIGSAVVSGVAANKAAGKAQDSANKQMDLQREQMARQEELQAPFREGGLTAQNRMLLLLGLRQPGEGDNAADAGKYGRDFSMADYQADPGYSFRLSEGIKQLQRTAAARGGLLSGSTLKGITRFGQDTASQEYQNAFNRYQVNRSNQIQSLQSLMGAGQSATNVLGNAGQQYANNMGESVAAAGNARGSAYTGMANAFNTGLGTYLNYQQSQNYMNMLKPAPGTGSTPPPSGP